MMTKEAIKEVLLSHRQDKRFTTQQLINLIQTRIGYTPLASEVTNACLELIEENEINLCHVFECGRWRYLISVNRYVVLKHNRHLVNDQKKKERRKHYC